MANENSKYYYVTFTVVCCVSVTLLHPTQLFEIFRNIFAPSDKKVCIIFLIQRGSR